MDQSGVRWPAWPVAGAVGAGRQDALPDVPAGFSLTPSAQAEQENWYEAGGFPPGTFTEEVPDGSPEPE